MDTQSNLPSPLVLAPRSRHMRIFLIACAVILTIILAGSLYEIYLPHVRFTGPRVIEIPPGFGSRMIGAKLRDEGFIRSKWAFVTYVSLRGEASSLKPGSYEFENAAIPEIARTLIEGVSREVVITLPEGATVRDLSKTLKERGVSAGNMFLSFATGALSMELRDAYPFLAHAGNTSGLEGYLFPDTYHLFKDAGTADIADTFLRNFDKKITSSIRDDIARSGHALHDTIIMASLIEKEVVSDEDRKIVSGILWKRLAINMPLQVDATINYIKKQSNPDALSNARLSIGDLRISSPYNTYAHKGLPPGPIGNPGLSAILAAIHPVSSPYLYYLSAPDGRTIFSRTLEDHNKAKQKYLTR